MLEARHVVIFTDHKPLTYAFSQRPNKCNPRRLTTSNTSHSSRRTCATSSGKTMWSPMRCLAWKQSAHQSLPTFWGKRRQETQNSPPFCKGPPPSGWRRSTFPAQMWFYNATRPQAGHARTFPKPSNGSYLTLSTVSATSEEGQLQNSFLSHTCGRACRRTAAPGYEHASLASGRRYPGTPPSHRETSPCLHNGSSICTLTSSAHFRHPTASDTALRQ